MAQQIQQKCNLWLAGGLVLAGFFVLAACQGRVGSPPKVNETTVRSTMPAQATDPQTVAGSTAVNTPPVATTYPGGVDGNVVRGQDAYPPVGGAGSGQATAEAGSLTPGPGGQAPGREAYPPPGGAGAGQATAEPGGQNPAPGASPAAPPTVEGMPTRAPADGLIAPSGTPTPTRVIQKELLASDPSKVQLASGRVQLIEFFAFWDGLSQSQTPMLHRLEAAYGERVNFIYLDVDDPANKRFKVQLGYKVQPEFFLLDKRGNILKQWSGQVDENELRAALDASI